VGTVDRLRTWFGSPVGAIVLLLLVLAVPVVQEYGPQSSSRFTFTGALVDDGTIRLDGQLESLGVDRIEHEGHTYSDKSPGQPFLAVPFYAAARAIGADPSSELNIKHNLGVWWLAIWFSIIPAVVIVVLTTRVARPIGELPAVLGAASLAFGWLLLPYSVQLYAHLFVAVLGYAAWLLLRDGRGGWRAFAAGAALGLAILTEYQMVLVLGVLGGWLVLHRRWGDLVRVGVAGLPFAVVLGWYQWAIFGDPFQSTYGTKSLPHGGKPTPSGFAELLVGTRGFVLYTPIVVVALAGMVRLARRGTALRADALVGLAIALAFVVLISGWRNAWGGDEPGPRYMIPALPFLVVGAAEAWRWVLARPGWLPYVRVAAIWSVVNMVGPLVTPHLIPHGTTLVRAWASRLAHGEVVPTLWTMWLGPLGWIPHLLLVALAFTVAVNALRLAPRGSRRAERLTASE
jgi:hypothetical protein